MYDSGNCDLYKAIVPANTSKIVTINFHDGEVFIPEQLISNFLIGDCVTTVKHNRGIIDVYNPTRQDVVFSMDRPIGAELFDVQCKRTELRDQNQEGI